MEVPPALNAPAVLARRNRQLAMRLGLVALFFGGFGFAMVPMYDVLCKWTGLNGKTNAVAAVPDKNTQVDTARWVTVQFLSHSMPGVGLAFEPEQFSMRVHPGAIIHTSYLAKNPGSQVFVGQAVPSITPAIAAPYFQKIECFCFSEQKFAPHEARSMPVVFVVKPDLDPDLRTITLSYTFFQAVKTGA
ncbi:MAG: cytochrome c oxidase assembly protein [Betaproteobacteria bacterium]